MKSKLFIVAFLLSLNFIPHAHAATDVMGNIYGQVFETMSMRDAAIPYTVSIDDLNQGEDCDNVAQLCHLNGFSWSNVVGWTSWDGEVIQTELGAASFPDEYIAKITYNGKLSGFIWGEKYGWVQLSACVGITDGGDCAAKSYCSWTGTQCDINKNDRFPEVNAQTMDDWGVYIDFCTLRTDQASCESPSMNAYCNWDAGDNICVFDGPANPNGQPLRGYAWSEYLGWIKFGPETGETEFTGAFTLWQPDLTPPTFEAFNNAWIPNASPIGLLTWLGFADENESLVDLINSTITINTDPGGDFIGCPAASPQANGNLIMTQNGLGEVDLAMPQIGQMLALPLYGFCKFSLGGVIYNGSGFGFYFGPEGRLAALALGLDIDNPDPLAYAPNTYDPNPVTLYSRAGDLSPSSSLIAIAGSGAVADGNNSIALTFSPEDVAGNPIVPVRTTVLPGILPEPDSSLWVRDVTLVYDFLSSIYAFDSLDFSRNLFYPAPISIEGNYYAFVDPLQFPPPMLYPPADYPPSAVPQATGSYLMDAIGFAPTFGTGNDLNLDSVALTSKDSALPAASPTQPAIPATANPITLDNANQPVGLVSLPYAYNFAPALEVTAGTLDSDFIVLEQNVKASFSIRNNSTDPLGFYSVDNSLRFDDTGGIGAKVLEINTINLTGLSDPAGRTDPELLASRYQLLHDSSGTPDFNQFHDQTQNFHFQTTPFFGPSDPDGVYQLNGIFYVNPSDPCISDPITCPAVYSDRTDLLTVDLNAGPIGDFSYDFKPSQYMAQASSTQVTFGIDQYLAYHSLNNPFVQYALYAATPFIDGVEVKSIGLGTSGVVGGQQVYETVTGRELQTISTASSADLRREIRKNVAVLTRNFSPCDIATFSPLASLPVAGNCVVTDTVNKTMVAIYAPSAVAPNATLQLGDGSNIILPAGYKYTLVLLNGANLYLTENIVYNDTGNSFGMIVMQDDEGKGGNVFINPVPTNMVGLLYAEGSIFSSPDGGSTFYYGGANDPKDLKNQLFWQGSLASRNTIGGAPGKVIPDGVLDGSIGCSQWTELADCAKAYDLDYVRRFATKHIDPENIDVAPSTYLFSSGGFCNPATGPNPGCQYGPLGVALSTVTLTGNSIDVANSKSLDTFFIERDNRPVPPGFSSGGGLTSTSEIR